LQRGFWVARPYAWCRDGEFGRNITVSTKRITNYARLLEDDAAVIRRLIDEWQPTRPGLLEKEYEQELFSWLIAQLPDVPMIAQYGIAKGKADIVIQDQHVIELKLGFSDVCELDRCIGQLERYRLKWVDPQRGPVYLIILGSSDPEMRDVLYQWFARTSNSMWFTWFHVSEKKFNAKAGRSFWVPEGPV
jgi:hypothetical protein